MGLWSLLTGWRKKRTVHGCRSRRGAEALARRCRFETMEQRRLLAADAIRLGVVYIEEDSGSDVHPDTFEIMFEGGAPGTELVRLAIDGDKGLPGLSLGDMIFDTVKGGVGADKAHPLRIVSSTGIDHVSWHVEDGTSLLIFEFRGFHAGEKLVFTIDVDEIQDLEPEDEGLNPKDWQSWSAARLNHINEGIDPIASGVEFQGSKLHADFQAPHYHDVGGTSQFRNAYDPLFVGSNLLISQGNASGLPHDDHLGKRDRTAGTMLTLQQLPKPVTIGGRVFIDNNLNLVQDSGELGIGNVTLALWQHVGGTWTFTGHTTTTNAQGDYTFGLNLNLQPGTYQVRQTQPEGYFSVGAVPGTIAGNTVGSTVAGNPDVLTDIAIPLGDLHGIHYNFAEAQPSSLRGRVHLTDADGNCFSEEALNRPLAGVKITLKDEMGNVLAVTFTNASGEYAFDNLTPGTYTIVEETPPGLIDGGDHIGTIGGIQVGVRSANDTISNIILLGGQHGSGYDFCEHEPAYVSGYVYHDANNNGRRDAGEEPIPGVTIVLLDAGGTQVATAVTDAAGFYKFDMLSAGTYTIRQVHPAGWIDGLDAAGTINGVVVGTAVNPGDEINGVKLRWGESGIDYNFGELKPGSIQGRVWHDANENCIFDPGETPLAGVTIELLDNSGQVIATTTTNAQGKYEFAGLAPGVYAVREIQPAGYLQGGQKAGSHGGDTSVEDVISQLVVGSGFKLTDYDFPELLPPPEPGPPLIIIPLAEPLPQPQPVFVVPPPVEPYFPTPQYFIPVQQAQVVIGGSSDFTWHLSIIDAGLPRIAHHSTRTGEEVFSPALWVERTAWRPENMRHGTWLVHGERQPLAVFGLPGATPVVGDWNGDGKTDIGIFYRGEWFLDLNGNGEWDPDDLWAQLGSEYDRPVTGDWNGDGKTDIGIFGPQWAGDGVQLQHEAGLPDQANQRRVRTKPKNIPPNPQQATDGERRMRLTAHGRERADLIDHVLRFGGKGDIPIAGDFNGDGIRTVGTFRDGVWHLDMDGDGRWSPGDVKVQFGQKGDLPVVGDFNGDGIEEIAIFRSGKWIIDTNGNRQIDPGDLVIEFGQEGDIPIAGDFNGDGTDQPAVYRPSEEAE